jgi:hypothetical protein
VLDVDWIQLDRIRVLSNRYVYEHKLGSKSWEIVDQLRNYQFVNSSSASCSLSIIGTAQYLEVVNPCGNADVELFIGSSKIT